MLIHLVINEEKLPDLTLSKHVDYMKKLHVILLDVSVRNSFCYPAGLVRLSERCRYFFDNYAIIQTAVQLEANVQYLNWLKRGRWLVEASA